MKFIEYIYSKEFIDESIINLKSDNFEIRNNIIFYDSKEYNLIFNLSFRHYYIEYSNIIIPNIIDFNNIKHFPKELIFSLSKYFILKFDEINMEFGRIIDYKFNLVFNGKINQE